MTTHPHTLGGAGVGLRRRPAQLAGLLQVGLHQLVGAEQAAAKGVGRAAGGEGQAGDIPRVCQRRQLGQLRLVADDGVLEDRDLRVDERDLLLERRLRQEHHISVSDLTLCVLP